MSDEARAPRIGQLQPGERFPTPEEEGECVAVDCPTCGSQGLGLPGSLVRCPACATRVTVPETTPAPTTQVIDLMEALKRSLARAAQREQP